MYTKRQEHDFELAADGPKAAAAGRMTFSRRMVRLGPAMTICSVGLVTQSLAVGGYTVQKRVGEK